MEEVAELHAQTDEEKRGNMYTESWTKAEHNSSGAQKLSKTVRRNVNSLEMLSWRNQGPLCTSGLHYYS